MIKKSLKVIFSNQKIRFIIIGCYNTLFSILCYWFLYKILHKYLNYILIAILNHLICVTSAFLCYKFFVFYSRGNFFNEYIKTHISYILALCINVCGLFLFVKLLNLYPVIANFILSIIIAFFSYFLHKHFSFKNKNS